jgi:hypothetical protein
VRAAEPSDCGLGAGGGDSCKNEFGVGDDGDGRVVAFRRTCEILS